MLVKNVADSGEVVGLKSPQLRHKPTELNLIPS